MSKNVWILFTLPDREPVKLSFLLSTKIADVKQFFKKKYEDIFKDKKIILVYEGEELEDDDTLEDIEIEDYKTVNVFFDVIGGLF